MLLERGMEEVFGWNKAGWKEQKVDRWEKRGAGWQAQKQEKAVEAVPEEVWTEM